MARTPKTVGPRRLRQRWRGEELWQVAGHNGQTNFVVNLVVAGGMVRSAPNLLAWTEGRDWLECVEVCLGRGWQVRQLDPDAALLAREQARNRRNAVQTALDLGLPNTSAPRP